VQDERDCIKKHLPIDRIVRFDHQKAGFSSSSPVGEHYISQGQLEKEANNLKR